MAEDQIRQNGPETTTSVTDDPGNMAAKKFRSIAIVTLLAGVVAAGLVTLLWLNNPSYSVLFKNLETADFARVSAELKKNNITHQYDSATGNVLVPERSLYQARFAMASQGLARGSIPEISTGQGDGISRQSGRISQDNGSYSISTRSFALETELAKTISSIEKIEWARVHLPVVAANVNASKDTLEASVVVRLERGKGLGEQQLASISHLVAASAANLSAGNVTIIDQAGNLLKSTLNDSAVSSAATQYGYNRMVEQSYIEKIENALVPIFGEKAIRVRVDADISFIDASKELGSGQEGGARKHVVNKLSATVVVDNKYVNNESGQVVSVPRSRADIKKIEKLVSEVIGIKEKRGDSVTVFNEAFGDLMYPNIRRAGVDSSNLKQYYLKILLAVLVGLLLVYYLFRFGVNKLSAMRTTSVIPDSDRKDAVQVAAESGNSSTNELSALDGDTAILGNTYEALLGRTRQLVNDDPEYIAGILKSWVRDNGR